MISVEEKKEAQLVSHLLPKWESLAKSALKAMMDPFLVILNYIDCPGSTVFFTVSTKKNFTVGKRGKIHK